MLTATVDAVIRDFFRCRVKIRMGRFPPKCLPFALVRPGRKAVVMQHRWIPLLGVVVAAFGSGHVLAQTCPDKDMLSSPRSVPTQSGRGK